MVLILLQARPGGGADAIALVFFLLIILAIIGAAVAIWGMIFSKAGYSFWMGLLMLLPLVNLVAILILAFSKWPVQQELETYRMRYGSLQSGFPMDAQGYAQAGYPQPGQGFIPPPPPR